MILRNPFDMLKSLHLQLLYTGSQDLKSFDVAVNAEEDRRAGMRLPKKYFVRESLYYSFLGVASPHVERYLRCFGEDNVKILTFDDFSQDTLGQYKDVLRFLGVDDAFEPTLEIKNPRKIVRNQSLHDIVRSERLVRFGKAVMPIHGVRRHLRSTLVGLNRRLNVTQRGEVEIGSAVKAKLVDRLGPDIDRLSGLIGRDLSHWQQ